ncbi:MAG TPA: YraN family protein [Casimicrobiaceae bacterium]|nr:YraN family protein [Casimicrobiaceae bacterium]
MRAERRASTQRAGAIAEARAAAFLEAQGLAIVARNVRSRFGEIDIVARDGDTLVFVEVRMRRDARFGGASASITAAKRDRIRAAASAYLAKLPRLPACRIDAVLLEDGTATIEWLRDVA